MKYVFRYIRQTDHFGAFENASFAHAVEPPPTLDGICSGVGRLSNELEALHSLLNAACTVIIADRGERYCIYTMVWDGLEYERLGNDTD